MKTASRKKEIHQDYREKHIRQMKKKISQEQENNMDMGDVTPIINVLAHEDSFHEPGK